MSINALIDRRADLLAELQTVTREIEDAQTLVYRHIAAEKMIVQRYFDGDRIVISFGRHWWVNVDGDLLGTVEQSDIDEIKALEMAGVFERVQIEN